MAKRESTNTQGVFYRETLTNDKKDKTYYVVYKNEHNKVKEIKIGKHSEGIRINYCKKIRDDLINRVRLGEDNYLALKGSNSKTITLQSLSDAYFNTRKEGKSKKSDIWSVNRHLISYFKDVNYNTISKEDIRSFQKYLSSKKTSKGIILSDKTVNNILTLLTSIVRFSMKEELTKNDITAFLVKNKIDNNRERYLTEDEIKILFKETSNDATIYLIFKLSLTLGSRLSTIMAIKYQDIDFENRLITLKDTKNNTTYKGFLTYEIKKILLEYTHGFKKYENLFKTNPEKRLRSILNELFNKEIEKDDRKNKVVFHTMRHTFASHLAIKGVPIYTIQKLLNHKDIKMTLRYAKLNNDAGREFVDNLYSNIKEI